MDHSVRPEAERRQILRGAAGQIAGGVAVVVALVDGEPHGATASSGFVASVDPPLFAVSFALGSRMHGCLATGTGFTASFLRQSDHALARRFANPARPRGRAGLAGVHLLPRHPAPRSSPAPPFGSTAASARS